MECWTLLARFLSALGAITAAIFAFLAFRSSVSLHKNEVFFELFKSYQSRDMFDALVAFNKFYEKNKDNHVEVYMQKYDENN